MIDAYEPALVTFIDILGFRSLLTTRTPAELRGLLVELQSNVRKNRLGEDIFDVQAVALSDSVVRITKAIDLSPPVQVDNFVFELIALGTMQMALIEQGTIIRGAVTAGNIFAQENVIFDPALARAYELEEGLSRYPRIIVDPRLIESQLIRNRDETEIEKALRNLLITGEDGLTFVDYLGSMRVARLLRQEMTPQSIRLSLEAHKNFILHAAANLDTLDSVASKYAWMIAYHNRALARLGIAWRGLSPDEKAAEIARLTIRSGDTRFMPSFIKG